MQIPEGGYLRCKGKKKPRKYKEEAEKWGSS
jgi:hypothetical protein